MTTIQFPTEFSELLKLLSANEVRYLVVGGYAVTYHGYPRTTGDLDLWIDQTETNAQRMVTALRAFGFDVPQLKPELFLADDKVVRMGYPPIRVEVITNLSGVQFSECYGDRIVGKLGGVPASIIGLDCLKKNKKATGRHKDLSDLDHLP